MLADTLSRLKFKGMIASSPGSCLCKIKIKFISIVYVIEIFQYLVNVLAHSISFLQITLLPPSKDIGAISSTSAQDGAIPYSPQVVLQVILPPPKDQVILPSPHDFVLLLFPQNVLDWVGSEPGRKTSTEYILIARLPLSHAIVSFPEERPPCHCQNLSQLLQWIPKDFNRSSLGFVSVFGFIWLKFCFDTMLADLTFLNTFASFDHSCCWFIHRPPVVASQTSQLLQTEIISQLGFNIYAFHQFIITLTICFYTFTYSCLMHNYGRGITMTYFGAII